jgi:hypothetical protein
MTTEKEATEKNLIELINWLKPYMPDERLEMLLEAARTTGIKELEQAIVGYWFDIECANLKAKNGENNE